MNLYRYKVNIPSNVRYGHWDYKFTIMSALAVIGIFIEFLNGSLWLVPYAILMQMVLINGFSENLSLPKSLTLSALIYALVWCFINYYSNTKLIIVLSSLYAIMQFFILLGAKQIDDIQDDFQNPNPFDH